MEEDRKSRDQKWNELYDGLRIVMWDNTNLDTKSTSPDSNIQSNAYYSY